MNEIFIENSCFLTTYLPPQKKKKKKKNLNFLYIVFE